MPEPEIPREIQGCIFFPPPSAVVTPRRSEVCHFFCLLCCLAHRCCLCLDPQRQQSNSQVSRVLFLGPASVASDEVGVDLEKRALFSGGPHLCLLFRESAPTDALFCAQTPHDTKPPLSARNSTTMSSPREVLRVFLSPQLAIQPHCGRCAVCQIPGCFMR